MKFLIYLVLVVCFSSARADAYVEFFRSVNIDNVGVVTQLLARGFDPNAANEKGQVGLFLAMRDESPKVAQVLLAHPQIRVDAINASNETPLMMAAIKGNAEWVKKLIARGAQINREGWTPLHYAASSTEAGVVALLLERGATVDARAPNGNTALMMAASFGPQDATDLLLQRGADPRARNTAGLTAADFARNAGRDKLAERLDKAAR